MQGYSLDGYTDAVLEQVAKFKRFCALLGLELEPFQKLIVAELFSGRRELLVLLPRGNGKTTLFAALALFHLLTTDRPQVYVGATDTKTARITFEKVREFARMHPAIEAEVGFKWNEVFLKKRHGHLRILSSDADRAQGLEASLVLIDELHAHKNNGLYRSLKTAMGKRTNGQLCTITTAGHDQEGVLATMRKGALKYKDREVHGTLTVARNAKSNFAMFEWACREDDDLSDAAVLKTANPASFVTEAFLDEQINSPGLHDDDIATFHANVWRKGGAAWLARGAWEACYEAEAGIPLHAPVYLGVDIGIKYDASAVVALFERDDGRVVVKAKVFEPVGDGTPLDLGLVENYVRELADDFTVKAVTFDKWNFSRSAQMLSAEGLLMVEVPLSNERMVPASKDIFEAINSQVIAHDDDPVLAAHVAAGVRAETPRGWRIDKGKAKDPVDALIAMTLAYTQVHSTANQSVYNRRDLIVLG